MASLTTELKPSPLQATASANVAAPEQRHPVFTALFVVVCIYLGIVVMVLPWRDAWVENSLLVGHPGLKGLLAQNFVRGVVSGLGLLDVALGISAAVAHWRAFKGR